MITSLKPDQQFCFGSNLAGIHGAGAALYAKKHFGAVQGVGEGPTGQCYALPTKDYHIKALPLHIIELHVDKFLEHAWQNPNLEFLVTPVGCGLAGYQPSQIAPFFKTVLTNVVLPEEFLAVLKT